MWLVCGLLTKKRFKVNKKERPYFNGERSILTGGSRVPGRIEDFIKGGGGGFIRRAYGVGVNVGCG